MEKKMENQIMGLFPGGNDFILGCTRVCDLWSLATRCEDWGLRFRLRALGLSASIESAVNNSNQKLCFRQQRSLPVDFHVPRKPDG